MVQGKKQLNSKPKFAEVVIGDNEAKEMRGYGSHHLCNRQKGVTICVTPSTLESCRWN